MQDSEIQVAAEELPECQHPVLGSPSTCDSFNASLESDTTCSIAEGGVDTDRNRSHVKALDIDSGSKIPGRVRIDSNCEHSLP